MNTTLSKIDAGGRLIIPAHVRKALHLEYGGPVVLTLVDGELRVRSVASAMAELQAQASSYLAGDGASVDAFLAARRAEAAKEEGASTGPEGKPNAITTESDRGA
ncbi:AbrB/MazE/SpoVT family DNA-binding domain-containing protein [Methylobacterium mesophilicum SR1.6/6]|uniref:AbrB/MazE/SpoVT family DNA-binding domain-containing protein n=1 Tax=Methylobacterium mesophilicum SR1.6/6 TaxID=908290 RepID=A0A6B9FRE2_9HYPH|nr:AbrB/MazE/SpoVT family DNA-binding domain-containing protein [Methylobacterium mesophilicum]QGY03618.1 AbrB/MazE/SpoVT family DNA-binding domain-containing protein [Methylobacterium mesophilicum SR1.6/6]